MGRDRVLPKTKRTNDEVTKEELEEIFGDTKLNDDAYTGDVNHTVTLRSTDGEERTERKKVRKASSG